jgi:hypothetical protein
MPTAVERGVGLKAILEVLRENRADPPTELGHEFGQSIKALNFTMPAEFHFGEEVKANLLLPAVQVDVLGISPLTPDDGGFY